MKNNQKALVLDFGGVISRTLFETHVSSEIALGLPASTLQWRGPFDPSNDALWRDMQAGIISERDYWLKRSREVGALLGEQWHDMQTLVRRARGAEPQAVLRQEAISTIEMVKKQGYRLAILSNELDLFYGSDFGSKLPLLDYFEVIVDATHTGILKPDLRAYEAVCVELNVPAGHCVFVDDQMKNIVGAQAAGMKTVWFDVMQPEASYALAVAQLEAL